MKIKFTDQVPEKGYLIRLYLENEKEPHRCDCLRTLFLVCEHLSFVCIGGCKKSIEFDLEDLKKMHWSLVEI